jgi:predicted N-acetyltransferase YhbS
MITLSPERPADTTAVRQLLLAGFPSAAEAALMDALRASDNAVLSLVARDADRRDRLPCRLRRARLIPQST